MSLITQSRSCLLLSRFLPSKIQKRFSTRESIHRYVEPDKFKKHMLAATQPYIRRKFDLPSEICEGNFPKEIALHPLQQIYVDEVIDDIKQNDFVLFIQHNYTPFQSERVYKNTIIKSGGIFRSQRNEVYREAFKRLEVNDRVQQLFVTRNSLVIGKLDKLATCVSALKKMPQFILLAGCIEREIYNYEQIQAISSQPNLEAGLANLIAILETPLADFSYYLEQYVESNRSEEDKLEVDNASGPNQTVSSSEGVEIPAKTETTNGDDNSPTPPSPTSGN